MRFYTVFFSVLCSVVKRVKMEWQKITQTTDCGWYLIGVKLVDDPLYEDCIKVAGAYRAVKRRRGGMIAELKSK